MNEDVRTSFPQDWMDSDSFLSGFRSVGDDDIVCICVCINWMYCL